MYASFVVERSRAVRKMRSFTRCWRKLCVILLLLEIFRRLNATSIAFYTSKAMHAVFGVERSTPVRKMRSFTRFWRELSVTSLLFEIFRRLNSILIAVYTPIATHAVFSIETSPTVRKMRTYTRSCRKRSIISLLLEIFRRLHAITIIFYFPKAMYASCIIEWSTPVRKMRQFTRFWRQTERYLAIVGDISTFIRYFHFILHAECYASLFLSSIEADLCEKCLHLLDIEENWELFRFCLRYFDV